MTSPKAYRVGRPEVGSIDKALEIWVTPVPTGQILEAAKAEAARRHDGGESVAVFQNAGSWETKEMNKIIITLTCKSCGELLTHEATPQVRSRSESRDSLTQICRCGQIYQLLYTLITQPGEKQCE